MKLDLKSSLLVVFFIGFALFFSKWWLEADKHRQENNQLKSEIKAIQNQRDSLKQERAKIDIYVSSLEKDLENSKKIISQLDQKLASNQIELNNAKDKLSGIQNGLNATKKKIQELKKNPVKRTGNNLINSIKEKIK